MRLFNFDCGINLSRCGIEKAGCYGELWLRPLSQDLFSPRVVITNYGESKGFLRAHLLPTDAALVSFMPYVLE